MKEVEVRCISQVQHSGGRATNMCNNRSCVLLIDPREWQRVSQGHGGTAVWDMQAQPVGEEQERGKGL
jgi:hypothetical protein